MKKIKNILVTGGAGFIGSNFVHHIYHKYSNYRIYVLDSLTYAGNLENLKDIEEAENGKSKENNRYIFIKGDISDESFLKNLFSEYKFDYVFNFAAESHVDRSFFNFSNFVRTNVEGALFLAMMVKKNGGLMIHVSTDEVYGSIPKKQGFVKENAPFAPSNPYASSKAAAEILLKNFTEIYEVPVMIVRGTNNFGPYQYPEKLIPLIITNLLEGKKMPIHGTGKQIRQWIHTEDFCRGIDLVSRKGKKGEIYNIGGGESESNIEVFKQIAKILGKKWKDFADFTIDRRMQDMRYAINSSKIEKLGWKRKYNFYEELPRIVEWYQDNTDWWRRIKKKREYLDHYKKQSKAKYY